MLSNSHEYLDVLSRIKKDISASRHRAVLSANSELVMLYWRVGGVINEHAEWGNKFISTLAHDIRTAFPEVTGFSVRNLKYMAKFAREFDLEFVQTLSAQISWSHTIALMDKVKDPDGRTWYAAKTIESGWSLKTLVHQIEYDLYGRQALASKVTNFDRLLSSPESDLAAQALKDPYIFDFVAMKEEMSERDTEDAMVGDVTALLLELGTGFAFMGKQFHLVVGGDDFYIDLLFYNVKLKRYFVVELKAGDFKPEYTGKLNFYLSAVDDLLKDESDKPSNGVLLCKGKNNAVAEYSLKDLNKPIGVSEYRLPRQLPAEVAEVLPTPEDLENRLGK